MNELINKDYLKDLQTIKETIRQNQNKAMVIANSAMIMTYYEIGTIINKRKTWGSKYIQKLSEDLKEYGKGYSCRNLKLMSQFALNFTDNEIRQQPVAQIPWGTLINAIIPRSKSHEEMLWYINQTHKYGWSRSNVLNQFENKAYERNLIEPDTSPSIKSDNSVNELFKDSYVFDFLTKDNIRTEKELTTSLIDNVIKFIQELGSDFAFVGKEYKLTVPDDVFYIDILMYHLELHCYVVIEVKNRKFMPQDLGQLIFYVSAIDNLKRKSLDNETVGLVLCKDSNSFVAKNTLNKINARVGISKYKIFEELPEYLEKRLNEK